MAAAAMFSVAGRISLVLFLTLSMSYQSWTITVPSEKDYRFAAAPDAGKVIASMIDADDEHRIAHGLPAFISAVPCPPALSQSLAPRHRPLNCSGRFPIRHIQTIHIVLLI
jgi:hypothetical protein